MIGAHRRCTGRQLYERQCRHMGFLQGETLRTWVWTDPSRRSPTRPAISARLDQKCSGRMDGDGLFFSEAFRPSLVGLPKNRPNVGDSR